MVKNRKRLLSLVLICIMAVSMLSAVAFAENNEYTAELYISCNGYENRGNYTKEINTNEVSNYLAFTDTTEILTGKSYDNNNTVIPSSTDNDTSPLAVDGQIRNAVAGLKDKEATIMSLLSQKSSVLVYNKDLTKSVNVSGSSISGSNYGIYWYGLKYQSDNVHIDGIVYSTDDTLFATKASVGCFVEIYGEKLDLYDTTTNQSTSLFTGNLNAEGTKLNEDAIYTFAQENANSKIVGANYNGKPVIFGNDNIRNLLGNSLPNDADENAIIDSLIEQGNVKDSDGNALEADKADNYEIDWYVLKWESSSWHVDGVVKYVAPVFNFVITVNPTPAVEETEETIDEENVPMDEAPAEDPSEPADASAEEVISEEPAAPLADANSAVTGDNTVLWIVLLAVSGASVVTVETLSKKHNKG